MECRVMAKKSLEDCTKYSIQSKPNKNNIATKDPIFRRYIKPREYGNKNDNYYFY